MPGRQLDIRLLPEDSEEEPRDHWGTVQNPLNGGIDAVESLPYFTKEEVRAWLLSVIPSSQLKGELEVLTGFRRLEEWVPQTSEREATWHLASDPEDDLVHLSLIHI